MHAGHIKRRASRFLPLLVFFSILAGMGGLLLTSKAPTPLLSRWQGPLQDTLRHPLTHPYVERAKNGIPASWHQHYQIIQQYSAWLNQPLVSSPANADSDRHVAHDSWQQYVVPSAFQPDKGNVGSSSKVWQSLSVQMPSLTNAGRQLSSWTTSYLSKLPQLLPESQVAESATQSLETVEDSLTERVALKPELMWQHVVASVQRVKDAPPVFQNQLGSENSPGEALCSLPPDLCWARGGLFALCTVTSNL